MDVSAGHRYQFGDVEVDPACFAVRRAGRPVSLEPKAVTLLLYLLEQRTRVVSKDELVEHLWKDTFVTPNALTRLIAQLRRQLGDDAQESRYIQTLHRRGYRLVADVTVWPRETLSIAAPALATPSLRLRWIALAACLALVLLGLALPQFRTRSLPSAPAKTPGPAVQLTASLGLDKDPALSPDGTMLAWSSDASGRFEIYVKEVGGGRQRRVTGDGMQNEEPSWSPDGRLLAYRSRARRGIWVVPASGGSPRRLSDFGAHPSWSPDGTRVAFESYGTMMAARTEIWSVRTDGSDLEPITRAGAPDGAHQRPAWSPDGTRLAFVAGGPYDAALWIQDLASDQRWRVEGAHVFSSLSFSPGGDAIYWGETSRALPGRLLRQPLDPRSARPIGSAEVVPAVSGDFSWGIAVAGGRVAWVAARTATNLWTLPLAGGRPSGAPRPLTETTYRNTFPAFSPDGRRIAFQVKRPGAEAEVWTVDAGGGDAAPLSAGDARGLFPHWTPNGDRVLAVEKTSAGDRLSYLDLRSGRRDVVRALGGERHPRLSPDGALVAYHAPVNGTLQVFVAPVGTGTTRQVTFGASDVAYPAWSRDGGHLAVEVRSDEDVHIAVVPATGGPLRMITGGRGLHWPHSWAPDNEHIAFAGEHDSEWNLYSVSTRTGHVRQFTDFGTANGYVRYPAWSPLGSSIVFERAEARGNIWTAPLP